MYIWYVLAVFFILLIASNVYDIQQEKKKAERNLFKKQLLTPSGKEMFDRLRQVVPDGYIFVKVPYTDLFDNRKKNPKEKARLHFRFVGCCIDFVVCDAKLNPICLIKFDETEMEKKKLKKLTSEEVFAESGYHFIRYKSKNKPSVEQLTADIFPPKEKPADKAEDKPADKKAEDKPATPKSPEKEASAK